MKQQGQSLDADNLQEVLDAGANATRVGRQQFFTPPKIAEALMLPLPRQRVSFVDLTMGDGALLTASNATDLYGCDIDSRLARKPENALGQWNCVNADLTSFYPLLHEIDWRFDLCGLNPPFSVQWHAAKLECGMANAECPAVRATFHSAFRNPNSKIDSVLATLLIALDCMTERGEGYLICSQTKAEAITQMPIGRHVWGWLTLTNATFFKDTHPMDLAVLYFARSHDGPNPMHVYDEGSPEFDVERWTFDIGRSLLPLSTQRYALRKGLSINGRYDFCPTTEKRWKAAKEEWLRLKNAEGGTRNAEWNIWLGKDGKIQRYLTPFQHVSGRIPKIKVAALDRLHDQPPMSLVVQRASRVELLEAVHSDIWRVQPELVAEVENAIKQYHSQRAPFYQLNDIQRLGYLDEHDAITCKKNGLAGFRRGESYTLMSETITVERTNTRPSLLGKVEEVTLSGKELCFTIRDSKGQARKFSPRTFSTKPKNSVQANRFSRITPLKHEESHLPLETLVEHFFIPEVMDVAQLYPDRYDAYVAQIREIEQRINQLDA